MKKLHLLLLVSILFGVVTCQTQKVLVPTASRQIDASQVAGYHDEVSMTIAWLPYQDQKLVQSSANSWKVVKSDSGKTGKIPVILIRYPDSGDTIWLDMNTKNEVLGKLIKHTLMTQEPITHPLENYLQTNSCTKCHPKDVEVDFNR